MAAMMGYGPEMLLASQDLPTVALPDWAKTTHWSIRWPAWASPTRNTSLCCRPDCRRCRVPILHGGENADSVANVMGVARGEGVGAMSAGNGTKSKEGTPQSTRGSMPPRRASTKATC